jgi:hypothetical protein
MKTKLLKKVRKRYSITHYPNGVFLWDEFYKGPITVIRDRDSSCRYDISCLPKQVAYDKLYKKLLKWIQQDYGTFKSRRIRITSEQLWYKK